jgi:hypothetical protein
MSESGYTITATITVRIGIGQRYGFQVLDSHGDVAAAS